MPKEEDQEKLLREEKFNKGLESTKANVKAIGDLISGNPKADDTAAMGTLFTTFTKVMFKQGFGGGEIFPLLLALLFAPVVGMFALAHHLTYYDFSPSVRRIQKLAALVSPLYLWGVSAKLPEVWHPMMLIPAILPPLAVVIGFIVYVKRNRYPASEPLYPGEVFAAKILPIENRWLIYCLIAPCVEGFINVALGFTLMRAGGGLIGVGVMAFGIVQAGAQIIGGGVGFVQGKLSDNDEAQAEKAREETETMDEYKRTGRVPGQADATVMVDTELPDVDPAQFEQEPVGVLPSDQPFIVETQDQYVVNEVPAPRFAENYEIGTTKHYIATVWDDYCVWCADMEDEGKEIEVKHFFRPRGFKAGKPRAYEFIIRSGHAMTQMVADTETHLSQFLDEYFSDEEIDYFVNCDSQPDQAMFEAMHTKLDDMGALSVKEIFA